MNYSRRSLERLLIAVTQLEDARELKIHVRPNDVLAPNVVAQIQMLMEGKPGDIARELREHVWENGADTELATRAAVAIEQLLARIAELVKDSI